MRAPGPAALPGSSTFRQELEEQGESHSKSAPSPKAHNDVRNTPPSGCKEQDDTSGTPRQGKSGAPTEVNADSTGREEATGSHVNSSSEKAAGSMEMIDEGREDADEAGSAKGMRIVAELIESPAADASLQFSPLEDYWQHNGGASAQIIMMKSEACIHAQVSQNMSSATRTAVTFNLCFHTMFPTHSFPCQRLRRALQHSHTYHTYARAHTHVHVMFKWHEFFSLPLLSNDCTGLCCTLT
jgi:hypothetical protein